MSFDRQIEKENYSIIFNGVPSHINTKENSFFLDSNDIRRVLRSVVYEHDNQCHNGSEKINAFYLVKNSNKIKCRTID